ncbi:MAG TPA: zinc-dependent metalloprotease [Egibacteraceae bacterium]|nr:zinc-dependent metalloprotease [Egibacteraceae bacterium]
MTDPFSGGFDPRMFENVPLFRELAKVMSWRGGPVNWDLASQTALAVAEPSGGAPAGRLPSGAGATGGAAHEGEELRRAADVAELWLDQVTDLPQVDGPVRALSRGEWVRLACSSAGLGVYVEPLAAGMGSALTKSLPEEFDAMAGAMGQALGSMGAMLYGVQIGTVAGHLAAQLLGTYDLGVPTLDPRTIGTVGDTADRFARDYGFDRTEFTYWLALRESAHRRQFAGVRWLRGHVAELIKRFASEADLDPGRLMDQLGQLGMAPGAANPLDPEALREALGRPDAFAVEPTSAQRATLERLQALVAFTEGWVSTVVAAAAGDKLTALPRIEEAISRRRAAKGPGERFLEQLIGLDLQPRDLRLGRGFCEAVLAARGQEGLDRAWREPAHLPTGEELRDPSRWLVRMAAAELDVD